MEQEEEEEEENLAGRLEKNSIDFSSVFFGSKLITTNSFARLLPHWLFPPFLSAI